jgi:large-conductance mechanosensitive channel
VIQEFKDFLFRGNIIELAVAFVMGVAFAAAVFFFIVRPTQAMAARRRTTPGPQGMPDEERRHQELLAVLG